MVTKSTTLDKIMVKILDAILKICLDNVDNTKKKLKAFSYSLVNDVVPIYWTICW